MQPVLYQDNSGRFHWSLVDEGGVSMAVPANGFGSRVDALRAATQVHRRAGSAGARS